MIWDEELEVWVGPDPLHDREPDDDFAMSMFDPNSGEWLDAP